MRYEHVPATTDALRPFSITVGIDTGAGGSDALNGSDGDHMDQVAQRIALRHRLVDTHGRWAREQIDRGLPYLDGEFVDVTVSTVRAGGGAAWHQVQDAVRLSGHAPVLHHARLSDEQLLTMVDELAGRLAVAVGQERVQVTCRDRVWCLDRHPDLPGMVTTTPY